MARDAADQFRLLAHGRSASALRATDPAPARLALVFGGAHPGAHEIHGRQRDSESVHQFFGVTFGEAAVATAEAPRWYEPC